MKHPDDPTATPVHPHTRGDISHLHDGAWYISGSPPHAWGHCYWVGASISLCRFTPTRVGTFRIGVSQLRGRAVHPHTRGDIVIRLYLRPRRIGSPPHAWGHYTVINLVRRGVRFTPTRVGTLDDRLAQKLLDTVHPHTRGDIDVPLWVYRHAPGSPPHAWGHSRILLILLLVLRFTPTRVGTFYRKRSSKLSPPVHPHTRGDISPVGLGSILTAGSPPHAWGHCTRLAPGGAIVRFTPTRVGTLRLVSMEAGR